MLGLTEFLRIHQRLNYTGKEQWAPPKKTLLGQQHYISNLNGLIIVSDAEYPTPGSEGEPTWIHASMSRQNSIPDYEDLVLLHRAVFYDKWAYQIFAPPDRHINIHNNTLHLWGRQDGQPQLPDFQVIAGLNSI